jgi:bifunctional non-homologous end joining protein LigD
LPEGSYGAGQVYVWDTGSYELADGEDALALWRKGALRFRLAGKRLKGEWRLYRMKGKGGRSKPMWLLQKIEDRYAMQGHAAEVTSKS